MSSSGRSFPNGVSVIGLLPIVYTGGAYPARPNGVAGGSVIYIGPVTPSDWLTGDIWLKNA